MTAARQEPAPSAGRTVRRWLKRLRLALLLIVVVLVLIVMFQNIETTTYQALFWEVPVSRLLALLIVFVAGAAAGALALGAVRRLR